MTPWTLYGRKMTGSVAFEAALTVLAIPYTMHETSSRGPAASEAGGMAEIVRRIGADPRLAALWAEPFASVTGWEG